MSEWSIQTLLDPEIAGVMFTENPVTGADERVIEASWGLGEAVVAGLVIPDHYRIDRSGQVLERKPGRKTIAVRTVATGGTVEEEVPAERAEQLCLDDGQLEQLSQLAARCEQVYGPGRDIEWAIRRTNALPVAVPGRHDRATGEAAAGDRPGRRSRRDAPTGAALRRARPKGGRPDRPPAEGAPIRRKGKRW